MTKNIHYIRIGAIAAVFCLACVIYAAALFNVQVINAEHDTSEYPDGYYTISTAIPAARGEIYDRNGVALVKNSFSNNFVFEYDFIPASASELNDLIVSIVQALDASGESDRLFARYFPFEGTYPNLYLSENYFDDSTGISEKYTQFLSDSGLAVDTDAAAFASYFIKKYSLDAKNEYNMPKYSDSEITAIMKIRYCMKVTGFGPYQSYTVAQDVSDAAVAYIKEQSLVGISVRTSSSRTYEFPGYMSHILGKVGKIPADEWEHYKELGYNIDEYVGISGCEYAFEEYLHGTDGIMTLVYSKDGKLIDSYTEKAPVTGNDVYLTIDSKVQIAAEDGLAEAVRYVSEQHGIEECNAGAITAVDPNDGSVIAIASYPTYDLTVYSESYAELAENPAKPLLNRALNGAYTPGSTFKIGMAAACLSENVITPYSTVNCTGQTWSGIRYLNCWIHSAQYNYGSHGNLNINGAIVNSCNCFFYEVGQDLTINNLYKYFTVFGLGESTGIELGGVSGSLAGSPEKAWSTEDVMMASIGQSVTTVSPVQLANYVATVMNGGTRYEVHLLKEVKTYSGDPIADYEVRVLDSLEANGISLSEADLDIIQQAMADMVKSSSLINSNMSSVPVTVGGKTGTAQTGSDIDNALFVATAPYDDPEIVVAVVLEHGSSGSYTSIAAARTLEAYFEE